MADARVAYLQSAPEEYTARLERLSRRGSASSVLTGADAHQHTEQRHSSRGQRVASPRSRQPNAVVAPDQPRLQRRHASPGVRVAALAGGLLPATPDASPVRPRRGAETTTDGTMDHDDFYAAAHYRTANAAAARSAPSPASPPRVPATELAKALSLAWEWQREAARLDDGLKDARRVIASLEAKVQAAQQTAVVAGIRQTIAREDDTAVSPKSHAAAAHGAEAESTIARMLALADELRLGHLSCLLPHMKTATPVVVTLSRNALYLDESRTNDDAEDQLRTLLTMPLAELAAASISSSDAAAVDLETVDGKQARLLFANAAQASDFLTILQMRRDPASTASTATKPTSAPIAAGTGSGGKPTAVGEVTAATVFRPSAVHRLPRLTDDAAEDELLREVEALTAGAGYEMSSPRQQSDSGHPANRRSPMVVANTGKPQRVFDRLYDAKPLRGRQLEARQPYGSRPGSASPSQRSSSLLRRRSGSAGGRERDAVVVRGQSQSGLVVRSAAEAHPSEVAAYRALTSSFYTNLTSTRQDEPTREDEGDQRRLLLEQWNRIFGPGSEAPGQRLKHHQGNRSHSGRGQNSAATLAGTSGVNGGASSMQGRERLSAVSILGLDQLDAAPLGDVVAASNAILEQRRRQVRGANAAPVVENANDSVPSSLMPMPSPIGRRPTVHPHAEFPSPADARSSAPVSSGGARAVLPADVPLRTQAAIGSPPAAKAPPPPPSSLPPPTVPPPPPPPKKSVPPPPPPPPAKKSVPPPPPPPPKPRASASP
jgi:hypothetical protein